MKSILLTLNLLFFLLYIPTCGYSTTVNSTQLRLDISLIITIVLLCITIVLLIIFIINYYKTKKILLQINQIFEDLEQSIIDYKISRKEIKRILEHINNIKRTML